MLLCLFIGFSKGDLAFVQGIVILSVELLRKVQGFLARIEGMVEFVLLREYLGTFLVELQQDPLVSRFVLGKFKMPLGLSLVTFESIES